MLKLRAICFLIKFHRHVTVLSSVKQEKNDNTMILKLPAMQVSTSLFREFPVSVRVCLALASVRWPLHMRASAQRMTTFHVRILTSSSRVRTFTAVCAGIVSPLTWVATPVTLTHLVEDI